MMEIKVKIWPKYCFFDRIYPIRDELYRFITEKHPHATVDITINPRISMSAGLDGVQYEASIDGCYGDGEDLINEWADNCPTADKVRFE